MAGNTTEGSKTRWAYIWRNKELPDWRKPKEVQPVEYRPKAILDRPDLYIAENGDFLSIDLPGFTVTIKRRK